MAIVNYTRKLATRDLQPATTSSANNNLLSPTFEEKNKTLADTLIIIIDSFIAFLILWDLSSKVGWRHWIYRLPSYLALQFTVTIILLTAARLLLGFPIQWYASVIMLVGLALIFANTYKLLQYTRFGTKEVKDWTSGGSGKKISILISNLLYKNDQRDTLFELIDKYDPDIIVVLELTPEWSYDIKEFLGQNYPERFLHERDDPFGMGFYSKFPIEEKKYFRIYNDYPTLKGRVSVGKEPIDLWVVHPSPPSPVDSDTSIPKDVEFRQLGGKIDGVNDRTIVAGDLNDVAWSNATRELVKSSRLGDPRKGRGLINTFPVFAPLFGFPLDQVFLSDHFRVVDFTKLPSIGSDHYPLLISLSLDQ